MEPFVFADLARQSLRTIGAIGQGVTMSANDLQLAFEAANDMIDSWAAQRLTIFQVLLKTFPLVANQGSPDNPYTIGPGGDFDVPRPTFITTATMLVSTTSPPFKIVLDQLDDAEYGMLTIPGLLSALSEAYYYNGKFDTSGVDTGLGQFFLYPVPNGQQPVSLVLQLPTPMTGFADKTTTLYTFPFGYKEALRYQLAKRLAVEFGKTLSPSNEQLCIDTFAVIQRPNARMPNIRSDFGVPGVGATQGLYNWRTGSNTGRRGFY
jgi:hypothetical protein